MALHLISADCRIFSAECMDRVCSLSILKRYLPVIQSDEHLTLRQARWCQTRCRPALCAQGL